MVITSDCRSEIKSSILLYSGLFLGSSMAEQSAVNREVVGSSPTLSAKDYCLHVLYVLNKLNRNVCISRSHPVVRNQGS